MKKIVAVLLVVLSITILFSGCSEKEVWLPYELEFGMTYNEAKEVFGDIPELKEATANDGYLTENYSLEDEEINKYFEFLKASSFPSYAFSFNENKELYEFYCGNSIYFIQDDAENSAENLYNSYVDFYAEKTGEQPEEKEYSDGLAANWETDELGISVCMSKEEGYYFIYSVVHNKEFELSK